MRRYIIDAQENRYRTHWIISIAEGWEYGHSWSDTTRTIHAYKGSGDGEKIEINAPATIKAEFLHILLTRAFMNGVRVTVIPVERMNDCSLQFRIFEDAKGAISK